MSKRSFGKYQGAGNDFILIDDRALSFDPSSVSALCHRKYGIGADGVILLQNDPVADFRMRIFNADGSEAESCGNGLRCLARFLLDLGFPKQTYRIATANRIVETNFIGDRISVQMGPPRNVKQLYINGQEVYSLDTGVPHLVIFVPDLPNLNVAQEGTLWRHHPHFQPRGTNVNFVALPNQNTLSVRTFERGVEGETLACGTGATAVAVIASQIYRLPNPIRIVFPGGELDLHVNGDDVRMIGSAEKVFEGVLKISRLA